MRLINRYQTHVCVFVYTLFDANLCYVYATKIGLEILEGRDLKILTNSCYNAKYRQEIKIFLREKKSFN